MPRRAYACPPQMDVSPAKLAAFVWYTQERSDPRGAPPEQLLFRAGLAFEEVTFIGDLVADVVAGYRERRRALDAARARYGSENVDLVLRRIEEIETLPG